MSQPLNLQPVFDGLDMVIFSVIPAESGCEAPCVPPLRLYFILYDARGAVVFFGGVVDVLSHWAVNVTVPEIFLKFLKFVPVAPLYDVPLIPLTPSIVCIEFVIPVIFQPLNLYPFLDGFEMVRLSL